MVFSQNEGTSIETPKYYNAYYRSPPRGTLNLGNYNVFQIFAHSEGLQRPPQMRRNVSALLQGNFLIGVAVEEPKLSYHNGYIFIANNTVSRT